MICIDAFKNLYLEKRDEKTYISPCCLVAPVESDKIDFYHPSLIKIRESWLQEKFPNECEACEHAEKNNLPSRRQGSNAWYKDKNLSNTGVELNRLDYWVGDTCNLACVICSPLYSSRWKQEVKMPSWLSKQNSNKLWTSIDLTNIKFIHFNGGEPLLSKEHVIFLKSIPNKSQVHLNYNTNGTILPSTELADLWAEFNLVQLDFSIDDIGDRYNYQRYPADWKLVTENLQWYIDNSPVNCMFAINTTVSILNYSNLENLNSWLKTNFQSNRVSDPIEHRQQFAAGLFSLDDAKSRSEEIVQFLDDCDARRNTNWKAVFPELANFINT